MKQQQFITDQQDACKRLDVFLAENVAGISRSLAQKWLESGAVLVNGKPGDKKKKLEPGSTVLLTIPDIEPAQAAPQNLYLSIVFEDAHLLVVNKPKGMVVHPAPGNPDQTLVNALLYHCGASLSGIGGVARPGIVHRLDKDTSGLIMVAKNDEAHIGLSAQIKAHSFLREYAAVADGVFRAETGLVDAPIARSRQDRKKMAIDPEGRPAQTHYWVENQFLRYAYLRLRLETGRTHQIRVHLKSLGHPLAGDTVYGKQKLSQAEKALNGQCLHAKKLGFVHPAHGKWMEFTSDLPDYFQGFLEKIKKEV